MGDDFYVSVASRILIFAVAATSLNLILGYGGMVNFGHAAFVGMGAYAAAIAMNSGWMSAWATWPLAFAVGGVLALFITGEYLSVPASVGFIALLGVAVLNGLVLISYFNQSTEPDLLLRIKEGVSARFRPVLVTAFVASLGFMPMAISTSAGAGVQKPLATVVIGGLVSATLLTLFVLPIIYLISMKRVKKDENV